MVKPLAQIVCYCTADILIHNNTGINVKYIQEVEFNCGMNGICLGVCGGGNLNNSICQCAGH